MRVAVTATVTPTILNLMGEPVAAEKKDGRWIAETDALHPLFFPTVAVSEVNILSDPATLNPGPVTF